MLEIKTLCAKINETDILKGLSLTVKPGEIHAIMGPNGSGKSTLSKVVCGHPSYEITGGDVTIDGESILEDAPDVRAQKGLFMAFQYPVEIPGVHNGNFLRMIYNAKRKATGLDELDPLEFETFLQEKLKMVEMDDLFLERAVNHGFSGGEKKRNEILQMLVLEPRFVFLDETDSGLDIDALRIVSKAVNQYKNTQTGFVVITHYQRLLSHIVPDVVHVMVDGQLVKTGDKSLALELEEKGYDWLLT